MGKFGNQNCRAKVIIPNTLEHKGVNCAWKSRHEILIIDYYIRLLSTIPLSTSESNLLHKASLPTRGLPKLYIFNDLGRGGGGGAPILIDLLARYHGCNAVPPSLEGFELGQSTSSIHVVFGHVRYQACCQCTTW